jgi:ribosomal protein L31
MHTMFSEKPSDENCRIIIKDLVDSLLSNDCIKKGNLHYVPNQTTNVNFTTCDQFYKLIGKTKLVSIDVDSMNHPYNTQYSIKNYHVYVSVKFS